MRKLFLFIVLAVFSAISYAAVSININPNNVDFGTVSMVGHETEGVEGSADVRITWSGLQPYCGVYFEEVEGPEEDCAFWMTPEPNVEGYLYGGDEWTPAEGPDFVMHFYATNPGSYTAKWAFWSYTDEYWEVESERVYLTMKVTVIAEELPRTEMVRINTTSELKEGDIVVFVSESAGAVCGPLNGSYLPAITEDVTISDGVALVPLTAQQFTVSKYSGNWQFTTTDTGKRLHLDVSGKGAFTYADTKPDEILAGWGISISNGVAEVSKPDGTFPVEFNSDRFKPYKNHAGTDVALYKIPSSGSEGVESVQPSAFSIQKVLRDGQVLIERNGVVYTVLGAHAR